MVQRRDLMSGGFVAGLAALAAPSAEGATPPPDDDEASASAVNRLRETVEHQFEQIYSARWRGVSRLRQQQHTWLQATRKYPDFIEVGMDVWDNVYDWHVTYQLPANMTRLADGRYAMTFMFTTLLLRPDQSPDHVGFAFDTETASRVR